MTTGQSRHNRREFIKVLGAAGALSAVGLGTSLEGESLASQVSNVGLQKRILYFNDDSNALLYCYPVEPRSISNYVQIYVNAGVDLFSWDVLVNGVCLYEGSGGTNVNEGLTQVLDLEALITARNIHHLAQLGANPPAVVAEVCHRAGVLMIAGFRPGLGIYGEELMHNGHGLFYNPKAAKLPDKAVKTLPPRDKWYDGWADHNLITVLDWSYPEVRELVLAPIREVVEQFEVDGIELSTQGTIFFNADEAEQKAPIMTDFVRQVRQILDQTARKKGKERLLLCVRHWDDPNACLRFGLDVAEWVRQNLVDIVLPSQDNAAGIDFNAPIEAFVEMCKGHKCWVLPTINPGGDFVYSRYRDFDHRAYTLPQLRAVVESWYRRGASGISTYNYQHRRSDSASWEESIEWLEELADPALVRKGERVWPLFGISLSFKNTEVGVRKTISVPRYAVAPLPSGVQPPTLRFQALELDANDVLEIDVDGVRVPTIHTEFNVEGVHQGWITGQFTQPREGDPYYDLYPAFIVEVPLPGLRPSSQIGIRLVKRHLASEIQISALTIVTVAHAEENA